MRKLEMKEKRRIRVSFGAAKVKAEFYWGMDG